MKKKRSYWKEQIFTDEFFSDVSEYSLFLAPFIFGFGFGLAMSIIARDLAYVILLSVGGLILTIPWGISIGLIMDYSKWQKKVIKDESK